VVVRERIQISAFRKKYDFKKKRLIGWWCLEKVMLLPEMIEFCAG
jgi:hypothetical protein